MSSVCTTVVSMHKRAGCRAALVPEGLSYMTAHIIQSLKCMPAELDTVRWQQ